MGSDEVFAKESIFVTDTEFLISLMVVHFKELIHFNVIWNKYLWTYVLMYYFLGLGCAVAYPRIWSAPIRVHFAALPFLNGPPTIVSVRLS